MIMRRCAFVLAFFLLAAPALNPQPRLYERYEVTDLPEKVIMRFFGANGALIATVEAAKTTTHFRITTPKGGHGWIRVEAAAGPEPTYSYSTSSGRRLKLTILYEEQGSPTAPRKIRSIKLQTDRDQEVTTQDFLRVAVEEDKLFDTPELRLLITLLKGLANRDLATPLPIRDNRTRPNESSSLVPVQSQPCTVTCVRITWFSPVYFCWDETYPGACPCPQARGYWDLSCCCSYISIICVVECSRFPTGWVRLWKNSSPASSRSA
jgi:hypothetical protein